MSNFKFLEKDWLEIYTEASEAEKLVFVSPKASAILSRSTLEKIVKWLYENDSTLTKPYDKTLSSLMNTPDFKDILDPLMLHEINIIRMIGNNSAHGEKIKQSESLMLIKNLFRFASFLAIYYSIKEPNITIFDENLIPKLPEKEKSVQEIETLVKELNKKSDEAQKEREKLEEQAKIIEELKKQLEEQKEEKTKRRKAKEKIKPIDLSIPKFFSEKETRKFYIDILLKEAGWNNLKEGHDLEYEVIGMPISTNPSGKGYIDYVLWGDDGKPLAVVEAKRTLLEAKKGKHQAELYADCLEKMYNQRPIIFYTNGFETFIWNDLFSIERQIQGFYTKNELQLLINRRKDRKDLRNFKVDTKIIERPYQIEAVKRVAEIFVLKTNENILKENKRASLLVMATGSGKTRTAAAIVDMLTKCNWAKRVLFLADRTSLVNQAKNSFNEYLPNLTSIDLTKEKENDTTRLVFSTYPTIMNKIDSTKTDDNRFYGVGHFDLIIIDEAHRSVYQKYKAIFEYFDSLIIGLTATPKKEIDRNTYKLFGIEDNDPTFAYELTEAVENKYLVNYKSVILNLKLPFENIKYSELSEQEKEEYEDKFGDPTSEEVPDEISGNAINDWLFNPPTIDIVIEYLMNNGIKVQSGDKLGKSIIFARNKKHALFIEKRFNINYPEYSGKFLRVIAHGEDKAQDLLEKFVDKNEEVNPQIAVSVDMMDTGVDAPRVVNLVFFKQVKSRTKFWQMIGRGTRLCENLFSLGNHKKEFFIFDFGNNFKFFELNPEGVEAKTTKGVTQLIFEAKLEIANLIRENENRTQEEYELSEKYIEELHKIVENLDHTRFEIKSKLKYVVDFSNKIRWQNLSEKDIQDIYTYLSPIILPNPNDNEEARKFDTLILKYLYSFLIGKKDQEKYQQKIYETSKALLKKTTVPKIANKINFLKSLQNQTYWQSINAKRIEEIRENLRDLITFLDAPEQPDVYTNFKDEIIYSEIKTSDILANYNTFQTYKERVESYIRNHKNHIAIHKITNNKPITDLDLKELENILFDNKELGTKKEYIKEYGEQPLGKFIRGIVGLDTQAINEAFADFLQAGNLRADQMTFINNIITYLTKNGTIERSILFEPPFTNINDMGLLGVFDNTYAQKILKIIDDVNKNALIA